MELGNPGQGYGVMVIRGSRSSEAKAGIGIDPLIIRLERLDGPETVRPTQVLQRHYCLDLRVA